MHHTPTPTGLQQAAPAPAHCSNQLAENTTPALWPTEGGCHLCFGRPVPLQAATSAGKSHSRHRHVSLATYCTWPLTMGCMRPSGQSLSPAFTLLCSRGLPTCRAQVRHMAAVAAHIARGSRLREQPATPMYSADCARGTCSGSQPTTPAVATHCCCCRWAG